MTLKARQTRLRLGGSLPWLLVFVLVAGVVGMYLWASQGQGANDRPRGPVATVTLSAPKPAKAASVAPSSAAVGRRVPARPNGAPGFTLPRVRSGPPLAKAPDPDLVEASAVGPLPITGTDGRQPWRFYARPFKGTKGRPRIAIVVSDLGLNGMATETAIRSLPGAVSLAFVPYGRGS